MEVISELIGLALQELFEQGVDISDETETFEAECDIEMSGGVTKVTMYGWLIFIHFFPSLGTGWNVYYAMREKAAS